MQTIRTTRPAIPPSYADAFVVSDQVSTEYFRVRYRDGDAGLYAHGWQFCIAAEPTGHCVITAREAGALTQEQMRHRVNEYLRSAPAQ